MFLSLMGLSPRNFVNQAFFHLPSGLCCSKYYANLLCAVALLPYVMFTSKTTELSIVGGFLEIFNFCLFVFW